MGYSEYKGKHGTLLCLKNTALFHPSMIKRIKYKTESSRAFKKTCKKITTVTGLLLRSPAVTELLASSHATG